MGTRIENKQVESKMHTGVTQNITFDFSDGLEPFGLPFFFFFSPRVASRDSWGVTSAPVDRPEDDPPIQRSARGSESATPCCVPGKKVSPSPTLNTNFLLFFFLVMPSSDESPVVSRSVATNFLFFFFLVVPSSVAVISVA